MGYMLCLNKFRLCLLKVKFVLLLLVLAFNLEAKHEVKSNVYLANSLAVHLGGGYPYVFDDFVETTNLGQYFANIGVSYTFRLYNGFWFDVGLEYQNLGAILKYNVSGTDYLVYDTQGKEMLFHYKFNSTFDYQNFNIINMPIMVGYYNRGFYIGIGPKLGWCFNIMETSNVNYTTSSSYNQYIEDFVNMPNHYNATYTNSCRENLLPSLKLAAIFELGYDLNLKVNNKNYHTFRLSLFGEYSMFSLKSQNNNFLLYRIDENNASQLQLSPFYYIKSNNDNRVVAFYSINVGMKLSWVINYPHKNCKNCPNRWGKFNNN